MASCRQGRLDQLSPLPSVSASPDLEEQLADGTWQPADEHETSHTGLETALVEIHSVCAGVRPGVRRR
ncbi:hypothetical protein ACFY3M_43080 [Streptomyces mirabilis]|uniref:hypothetical protein n=1 Tax=Streptomyces mirabilis TaxID=68239 RepID=UPI0036AD5825